MNRKKILVAILVIAVSVLAVSCSKTNKNIPTEISSEHFKTLDTIVPFSGYWLNENYYNDILRYKSPKLAQINSEECFIVIPDRTLEKTNMIIYFHEGSDNLTILKNDNKYQLFKVLKNSVLEYYFDIELLSENKIKIDKNYFVKIQPSYNFSKPNNPLILEDLLFKGKHKLRNGKIVEFENNGKITGFKNYTKYYPVIDYSDYQSHLDQVGFAINENKIDWYTFKFEKDYLLLNRINE